MVRLPPCLHVGVECARPHDDDRAATSTVRVIRKRDQPFHVDPNTVGPRRLPAET